MEIKDINPTAQASFQVVGRDGSEQSITFTVTFLGEHMIPDYLRFAEPEKVRMSKVIQDALVDVVTAWDLSIGGKAVPCTDENKQKFFPAILGLKLWKDKVEGEDDGKAKPPLLDDYLGWALVAFAGESENFIKN